MMEKELDFNKMTIKELQDHIEQEARMRLQNKK
jgi:hypothetical protein